MEVAVIADELTAVGWALAGAQVFTPAAATVGECLDAALARAALVLLSAEAAALLPASRLQQAIESFPPLTLVITDVRDRQRPPDLVLEVRRALGVVA